MRGKCLYFELSARKEEQAHHRGILNRLRDICMSVLEMFK